MLRPRLPAADRLLPYLRRIDDTRSYTNWGPLASELEGRLAAQLGLPDGGVVTASSGTAALVGAILGSVGRAGADRPLAILPAFTFVATASAVEQCGYRPYLVDVDGDDWLLDADALNGHPMLGRAALVVPVATFGRPVAQEPWLAFRRRSGIPVVIDGAASFEALASDAGPFTGDIPVSMSFHATKSFATGEGGCVATTNVSLAMRVIEALNFGFFERRESRTASINGKMSEYHAAVGLAELDEWPSKRLAFSAVAAAYRRRLAAAGLADRLVTTPTVAGCYVLYRCADAHDAVRVCQSLTKSSVEHRLWYGTGLLGQPHFRDAPHDSLDVTERLAPLVIGLPVAPDLPESAIDQVVRALEQSVQET